MSDCPKLTDQYQQDWICGEDVESICYIFLCAHADGDYCLFRCYHDPRYCLL